MPVITLDIGRLDAEKKATLIREFVEAAHRVTGIPKEAFVTLINEHEMENIGNGVQTLAEKMGKK